MTPFGAYLSALKKNLAQGGATEHTHRPALKTLIESLVPGVTATNEPKRIACGAPDFNISRNKVPLGHMETKDIGANLDEIERGRGRTASRLSATATACPTGFSPTTLNSAGLWQAKNG